MAIIDRDTLRQLVKEWSGGNIDERDVHERAEELYEEYECPNADMSHPDSIPIEVLSQLEILNLQLITPDDVPAILQFLDTASGLEVEGWRAWCLYWEQINYDKRKMELSSNEYYIT